MAGTVKLPAIGEVPTKYAYAGVAIVVGIVGYAYFKRRQSGSAAATAAPDPNSIDPATGLTYAQEQAAGSVGTLGSTGYSNPNPNASGYSTVSGTSTITTNMDWSAAVSNALGNLGYDPTFIASTIGKYLSSQPLTADEAALIRVAWAYEGKPPSGPTNIVTAPTQTQTPVPTPPSRMSTKTDITVSGTTVGCGVHAVNGERGTGDAEYQYRGGSAIGWTTLTRIPLSAGAATLDLHGRLKPGNYSVRVAFHPSNAKFYPSVSSAASVTVK